MCAAPRVRVVGVAAGAGHLVWLPSWHHHFGERHKELAAQPLT